ncbi:Uncharacterized membrane protein [Sphingomonas guangdongensis]|uniref:Uncharacterized membrane protein n=1 Tax=Sphingomonas guangdongensis TaxID=1141890 RepID=A0A285QH60_9SPHN|nr:DUF2339 domain-containing protein [Sphingomonas guangdongensis]SOB81176.1 Uncharacterized membrane protein [Sphingomonas guangdongensis]
MTTDLLLLLLGAVAVALLTRRIAALERTVAALRSELRIAALDHEPSAADAEPLAAVAEPEPLADALPLVLAEPAPTLAERLEALVAGKLPIWTGGAALVVAGLFLVRYGIESGLIGPAVRVAFAALFSAALLAGSEATRRLAATRDDPRLAQVLSGAAIASAYGTLYVAAAQYHLIAPTAAFAATAAITGGALFLSLRHGAPTAVMALVGGFAAPLVAGVDAAGVTPLLGYLALLIAALFALAAARGWTWLAMAAVVAGFGWANLLVLLLGGSESTGVAAFVTALAIGATLALPRTGPLRTWLRALPLVAGLAQLLVLAPTLDFTPLAWAYHLTLAAAAVVLARRDAVLEGAALAAAVLVTVLLALAFSAATGPSPASQVAVVLATALIAGAGLRWSGLGPRWAAVALVGLAGPVLVAHLSRPSLLPTTTWSIVDLVLAAAAAWLSWRHRAAQGRDVGLVGGAAIAALLGGVALAAPVPLAAAPAMLVPALAILVWWGRQRDHPRLQALPAFVALAMLLLAGGPLLNLLGAAAAAIGGETLIYPYLPAQRRLLLSLALPLVAVAAALRFAPDSFGRWRPAVTLAGGVVAAATLYALAKQPLALATPSRFLALGFSERAAITFLFAGAGVLLARHAATKRLGHALVLVAFARALWFDLVLFTPLVVPQAVGSLPLLNAAVLLPALLALVARTLPGRGWRWTMLLSILLAVAAAVRQLTHGSLLTGPLSVAENWGYSAAFLLLAVVWLWRGLTDPGSGLRTAGLLLLTAVTLKVFLLDVAALGGVLRILSFLGLGLALIGIGWFYRRMVAVPPSR